MAHTSFADCVLRVWRGMGAGINETFYHGDHCQKTSLLQRMQHQHPKSEAEKPATSHSPYLPLPPSLLPPPHIRLPLSRRLWLCLLRLRRLRLVLYHSLVDCRTILLLLHCNLRVSLFIRRFKLLRRLLHLVSHIHSTCSLYHHLRHVVVSLSSGALHRLISSLLHSH